MQEGHFHGLLEKRQHPFLLLLFPADHLYRMAAEWAKLECLAAASSQAGHARIAQELAAMRAAMRHRCAFVANALERTVFSHNGRSRDRTFEFWDRNRDVRVFDQNLDFSNTKCLSGPEARFLD